jgi:hypothetical protein
MELLLTVGLVVIGSAVMGAAIALLMIGDR